MRKILPRVLRKVLCVAALALFAALTPQGLALAANAGQPTVLVLPFQANAGPDMPDASRDVPQLIITNLEQNGLRAVPLSRASGLLRASGGETIDLATARRLGRQAGADIVIYGNFNQLGDGFTMETRLVPVYKGEAVPASFERQSLLALGECAQALAQRASSMAAPAQAPAPQAQATSSGSGFVPMGAPAAAGGGLSDVQVRGMNVLDPDTVLMRLTIRKGDTPDAHAINEEIKRIWDMGYFSDV